MSNQGILAPERNILTQMIAGAILFSATYLNKVKNSINSGTKNILNFMKSAKNVIITYFIGVYKRVCDLHLITEKGYLIRSGLLLIEITVLLFFLIIIVKLIQSSTKLKRLWHKIHPGWESKGVINIRPNETGDQAYRRVHKIPEHVILEDLHGVNHVQNNTTLIVAQGPYLEQGESELEKYVREHLEAHLGNRQGRHQEYLKDGQEHSTQEHNQLLHRRDVRDQTQEDLDQEELEKKEEELELEYFELEEENVVNQKEKHVKQKGGEQDAEEQLEGDEEKEVQQEEQNQNQQQRQVQPQVQGHNQGKTQQELAEEEGIDFESDELLCLEVDDQSEVKGRESLDETESVYESARQSICEESVYEAAEEELDSEGSETTLSERREKKKESTSKSEKVLEIPEITVSTTSPNVISEVQKAHNEVDDIIRKTENK